MSADDRLMVWLHGEPIAHLTRTGGRLRLEYLPAYLARSRRVPLSLSLPGAVCEGDQVGRWINGLLPGRAEVRERWRAHYGAASSDPFDLLSTRVGHDCAGAVQFTTESGAGDLESRASGVRWLTDGEYTGLIDAISRQPHGWGSSPSADGFSLAGAYPKVSLTRRGDGTWGNPHGGAPSTHILKPSTRDAPEQAVNEFLVMRAASLAGVDASEVEIDIVDDCPVLIVRRFDRGSGRSGRTHQEDLHQAVGEGGSIYQLYGGLAPGEIAAAIRLHGSSPRQDAKKFLNLLVYRWAAGDADGHAKNYTLLLGAGIARLAPLYDSWSAYLADPSYAASHRMAMWAGDSGRFLDAESEDYWADMARALGLRSHAGKRAMRTVAEGFAAAAETAAASLPDHPTAERPAERLLDLAQRRLNALPRRRATAAPTQSKASNRQARQPLPEPKPRCGAWMPISQAHCILPEEHDGPHRSRR